MADPPNILELGLAYAQEVNDRPPVLESAGLRSPRPAAAVMSRNRSPTMRCSTPAVFTAAGGQAQAAAYLRAAEKLFAGANLRYVGKWFDAHSAARSSPPRSTGSPVEGIDMIHWNADGKITVRSR